MKKIVLTYPWTEAAMKALRTEYHVCLPASRPWKKEELLNLMEGADAFCPVFYDDVNSALIGNLPESIKIIASFGVGTDHIDLKAARDKGLLVTNTPDVLSDDTADIAIGLIISTLRGFSGAEGLVRKGKWRGPRVTGELGRSLKSKTLGIIGLGRIGKKVARRARVFGMDVAYTSRTRNRALEEELVLSFFPTEKLLVSSADVISLHCPLTEETRHLIDEVMLKNFKPGSFLVNTGRGPLVDEKALVAALKSGQLAGAGLDVYENEPELAGGLANLENVTLLPHLGSATVETRTAMGLRVKENLDQFFAGNGVRDPVVVP